MTLLQRIIATVFSFISLAASIPAVAATTISAPPTCTPQVLQTLDMFQCVAREELPAPQRVAPTSYLDIATRSAFPADWHQLGHNQRHNPVFPLTPNSPAPSFLQNGTFWVAPLTGLDFIRLARAADSMGNDEAWGSRAAQYLGNVVGASVAQGIVYVQLGRHEIWALDAASGKPIWMSDLSTAAGMGQTLVQEINGRLIVFVPVGDAAFTVENAIAFSNGEPHDRGANFTGLYAFDGVTGQQLWRLPTKGATRPTPVYHQGNLYVATGGGEFFVVDAVSGKQLGSFTNPGEGFPGLASLNWYQTVDGRTLAIYGTVRPRRILAIDASNPAQPVLAWSYTPPDATANAPGDTPVAVDPDLGMVFTTVFSNVGGSVTTKVLALDANTGAVRWSDLAGGIDAPPGYKGSIPMVHNGGLYVGNTSNGKYRAYDALSGKLRWEADLTEASDPIGFIHRPRAAAVFYQNKLIVAEGRDISTFDPNTGVLLNRFETPGTFTRWGINQPVIVGNLMILSSISGWVFAAPADVITTTPGFAGGDPSGVPIADVPLPPQQPQFFNSLALPSTLEASQFPNVWLKYAGTQSNNAVVGRGPSGIAWQTALDYALPLDGPAFDETLYGTEAATHMTHLAFGVGTGITPVNGIAYAGSDRFGIYALNALTGEPIWRFRTQNANFGQPLVTPNTVIVSGGDQWMNLGGTGKFKSGSPATNIGDNFPTVHGLDPTTGVEKWTVYSGNGTSAMTPLYYNGNLYWINGEAKVWAVNADSGAPVAPFMDVNGLPILSLGGFNAISSANIVKDINGRVLMVVGTAMPNKIWGIDLTTATVAWSQELTGVNTYATGFATGSAAADQNTGLIYGTVLSDADALSNTINVQAIAIDITSGTLAWSQSLGRGAIPTGYVGPTPFVVNNTVFVHNPLSATVFALDASNGGVQWQNAAPAPVGKYSWGPGVVTRGQLILPVGPDLYTFDAVTGTLLGQYPIGGSMTFNGPTVIGKTLYVGNSWGWVSAVPLQFLIY